MRGLKEKHKRLGYLLSAARGDKGLSLENAARILGFYNRSHLHLAESGGICFSANKLRRAIKLYQIDAEEVIEASLGDYQEALLDFFA